MRWLVGRWWFWVLAVAILFAQPLVRTFLRKPPVLPKVIAKVPAFALEGELAGRVWLASDPGASNELLRLHTRLRKLGDSFRIVVLAPDGRFTPPERVNPRVWKIVTGDDAERLAKFLRLPSSNVAVIDGLGQLRGRYDPTTKADEDALVSDVGLLVNNY